MNILYRKNKEWDSMIITINSKPGMILKHKIVEEIKKHSEYESIDIIEFQVVKTESLNVLVLTILVSFAIV